MTVRSPSDCRDPSQVRTNIDALDDERIALLDLMAQAKREKTD
jgi:hypothetical protein